ncbi:hypothetical protein CTI12_AA348540 [Artemisia annua]|uniref:Uncharacterized protein n=1 Tax=Artemisia annua TaxID=35608 RepID=A0A2U1MRU8_ARTAN|nr:hypothetical protein CTI12_AA348540 [Artemisia annua]
MPKITTNNNNLISKSKSKPRIRKPLRELSNAATAFKPQHQQQQVTTCGGYGNGGDSVDRLMLVHSDLSVIMNQIDELVVQAVERKVRNKKDIESFANVLHDMQTTLKPWVSRFKKAISTESTGSENHLETCLANLKIAPTVNKDKSKVPESPKFDKFDFLVSPSPLVSWRADHAPEGSRNLFLLTPLPRPTPFASRIKTSSKSVFEKITDNIVTVEPVATAFSSPEKTEKKNDIFLDSTPYLKMSPPKSCILLEPPSVGCNKITGTKNPTMPHPVGGGGSGESEASSIQPSRHLALKYPELFGIRTAHKVGNTRRVVESSPNWYISPPKSCVLLEPSDDDIKNVDMDVAKTGGFTSVVSCNKVIESTPMCKDLDTTILKGKRAGENTLKKELWTRFEAATAHGFHLKASVDKEIGNASDSKGFMDLLEEASCDDATF